ncbi:hypothetical protein COS78_03765 [Candidatus Shapirobacteria bacterium CG06_land_8_20_14_3_00_40_12]|uniref:Uncharacterized protein n=1 Tax=Candidatus Shapirobacteria bacterium CG06_land_8_20_14_3_00_40_12 TaxID=1974881 RepID=A0A2M7ARC4_9BACT|nr:MAG: hypothetical protein COS78_03765 [Candidatus Shapirobacteria bacterium CG06_land_8_20_14_3_00_40_12]
MPAQLLLSATISLVIFQLLFSFFYSSQIVKLSHDFSALQKKYREFLDLNQNLEQKYVQKFTLFHE